MSKTLTLKQNEPLEIINCTRKETTNTAFLLAERAAESFEVVARIYNGGFVKMNHTLWARKFYTGVVQTVATICSFDPDFIKTNNLGSEFADKAPFWIKSEIQSDAPSCSDENGERGVTPTYSSAEKFIEETTDCLFKVADTVKQMVILSGNKPSEDLEQLLKTISAKPRFENMACEDVSELVEFFVCEGKYYALTKLNNFFKADFKLESLEKAKAVEKKNLPKGSTELTSVLVYNTKRFSNPDAIVRIPAGRDGLPDVITCSKESLAFYVNSGYRLTRCSLNRINGENAVKINLEFAYNKQEAGSLKRTTWFNNGLILKNKLRGK